MKNIQLIVFSMFIGLMMSCSSNGEGDNLTPTQQGINQIAQTWRVNSVAIGGQNDISTDYSIYRFTFNADGTFNFVDPTPRSGTWRFLSNGRTEQVTIEVNGEVYNVVFLSGNQLVFDRAVPATFKSEATTARFDLSPL